MNLVIYTAPSLTHGQFANSTERYGQSACKTGLDILEPFRTWNSVIFFFLFRMAKAVTMSNVRQPPLVLKVSVTSLGHCILISLLKS